MPEVNHGCPNGTRETRACNRGANLLLIVLFGLTLISNLAIFKKGEKGVQDPMGPATGHGREPDERAYLDRKFVELSRTLTLAMDTRHNDFMDRVFGDSPMSMQSQITAIKESTISDAPLSLRSQFIEFRNEIRTEKAVSRGRRDLIIAILTFLFTVLGLKWKAVAAVIIGTSPTLPMFGITITPIHHKWFYQQCMKVNYMLGRWECFRVSLSLDLLRAVELARRVFW